MPRKRSGMPLRVINAIHPNAHERRAHAVLAQQFGTLQVNRLDRCAFCLLRLFETDADRKWTDLRLMPFASHRKTRAINARFKRAIHRIEEVIAMGLDMKADQIRAQQAFKQLLLPGTNAKRF